MAFMNIAGKQIEIDEDGFLVNPEDWSDDVVTAFAALEDVPEVTEEHWKVINYLRGYFKQFGIAPMIRKMCKDTGLTFKQIYDLFLSGPAKGACKLAGLPKPTGCV